MMSQNSAVLSYFEAEDWYHAKSKYSGVLSLIAGLVALVGITGLTTAETKFIAFCHFQYETKNLSATVTIVPQLCCQECLSSVKIHGPCGLFDFYSLHYISSLSCQWLKWIRKLEDEGNRSYLARNIEVAGGGPNRPWVLLTLITTASVV
jgi:hypothetical protein